jgi:four helix bundle protein
MKDFRDLKVWEKSHGLTLEVYRATAAFPRPELYGLTGQIRRCSASVGTLLKAVENVETTNSSATCR